MAIRDVKDILMFWGMPAVLIGVSYFLLLKNKRLFFVLLFLFIVFSICHVLGYVKPSTGDKYNIANRFVLFIKIQIDAVVFFVISIIYWIIKRVKARRENDGVSFLK